ADTAPNIEAAFGMLAERGATALLVGADPLFYAQRAQIVGLSARYAVPAMCEFRGFVDVGGLASYGAIDGAAQRQQGHYTRKILAGAKPADLPVAQPTRFEFVINLRTANALGLSVPQSLLARADEVIE